jgi:hypothetical protein
MQRCFYWLTPKLLPHPIPSFFVRLTDGRFSVPACVLSCDERSAGQKSAVGGGLEPRAVPTSCRDEHGEAPPFDLREHGATLATQGAAWSDFWPQQSD